MKIQHMPVNGTLTQ